MLNDLKDTIGDNDIAIAIAAMQIGEPVNVVVISFDNIFIEAINPRIIKQHGEQYLVEACLSLPGIIAPVPRAFHITVEYQDRHGYSQLTEATGLMASIWQHEIEHLNGGLYIDNLSKQKRKKLKAQYNKRSK